MSSSTSESGSPATSRACLPTFLILGAAKSGTTSLFRYLGEHPEIYVPSEKEPHFFAFEGETVSFSGPASDFINPIPVTSLSDYQALFEDAECSVRGEASATSLYHPQAPERIQQYVPDADLFVVLRDPVERAYSSFLMMTKMGFEPKSDFASALDEEETRLENGWCFMWDYTGFGFYHRQLSRYYERFPEEQIHVYLFEDLVERPRATVRDVFQVLGVDSAFEPDVDTRHNASGVPRSRLLHSLLYHAGLRKRIRHWLPEPVAEELSSRFSGLLQRAQAWKRRLLHRNLRRPPMPDDVRSRLRALYRDDVERLESLINRDLSHWKE